MSSPDVFSVPPITVAPGELHIPLKRFLDTHSQREAGLILSCGQTNVSLSVRLCRDIYIVQRLDGTFTHYEIVWPRSSAG